MHRRRAVGAAAVRHWIACGHGIGLARWRCRAAAARAAARLRRRSALRAARRGWECWEAAAAARRIALDRASEFALERRSVALCGAWDSWHAWWSELARRLWRLQRCVVAMQRRSLVRGLACWRVAHVAAAREGRLRQKVRGISRGRVRVSVRVRSRGACNRRSTPL